MKSWITYNENNDFSIYNFPFGIGDIQGRKQVITRIGDYVVSLNELRQNSLLQFNYLTEEILINDFLNNFIQLGKQRTTEVRNRLIELFSEGESEKLFSPELREAVLHLASDIQMSLPVRVGDYTDFYSSIEHATNVGKMFRDPANALLPNWKHIPVGYHGRASSIILSGQPVHRPKGQTRPNEEEPPVFGPSGLLDFELEIAFVTFDGKALGHSISTEEADNYIFGMCLFNDWSARDIQKWEYVPLGPFLAKNFASSISPWIITLDALEAFRVAGPKQDPEVLPYLQYKGDKNIDINLEVAIHPENSIESIICHSNYKYMYWNMEQQLAHHTISGCNIKAGDMMASGTISGSTEDSYGSMLELSWKGTKPLKLDDGSERKFIQDHDTVIMRGHAEKNGRRVGFGEVRTKILPAI